MEIQQYKELLSLKEEILGDICDLETQIFTAAKQVERRKRSLDLVEKLIRREDQEWETVNAAIKN